MSRRDVMRYGAAAGAGLALPAVLDACGSSGPTPPEKVHNKAIVEGFPEPEMVTSNRGELSVKLTAKPAMVDMGAEKLVSTYTYDGIVPGKTWELYPGDVLKVDLVNDLPPLPPNDAWAMSEHGPPRPHMWTNTNLHTHGLHVSPAGNADNVFVDIAPGDHFQYEIPVPDDHTGGIFWYHPHRHGAVTHQVRAGMAGLIIVRGEIDKVPEVKKAQERIMVVQAIELNRDFKLADPIPNPTTEEAFFPRNQVLYTVNGVLTPTITMAPGEVQRWRILNGAEGKFISLRLEGHPLNVVAWDGLTLAAPEPQDFALLAAGNRMEALVKAEKTGIYNLMIYPASSQVPDVPGMPDMVTTSTMTSSSELRPRVLARVEVQGKRKYMGLPKTLPAYDPPILPIAKTRRFAFTVQRTPTNEFISFGVDGVPFDPANPPYQMKLGTAEEWTLVNEVDHKLARHAHGLHIHVNPFKITKVNGQDLPKPLWRDTYVLTGADANSLTFQSNFDDFTGKFVEHCHVLGHEDLGMMESLEVIP